MRNRHLRLRVELLRRGITQTELAYSVRIDPSYLSKLLNGWLPFTDEHRGAIAQHLRMDIADLFGADDTELPASPARRTNAS